MSEVKPPPNEHPITSQNGIITPFWGLFMDNIYKGSTGTDFTPAFTNLTEVGGDADIIGKYYRIGRTLAYFNVSISPQTNTSATAGNTYFDFPLDITGNGVCFALAGTTGAAIGTAIAATDRIYTPSWTNETGDISIVGLVEAT